MVNEGVWDRLIRIVLGLFFLYAGYALVATPWNYVAYIVGFILVVTGIIGFCLIYKLFGINTKGI